MNINGVNNNLNINTVQDSKSKASDENFKKHLENSYNKNDEQQLKKVCKEFEGMLLNTMYKQMRASVPKSELLPGDIGRDVFESMLDDKLVEEASKGTGVGVADILYKQLSKQMNSKYKTVQKQEILQVDEN